LALGTNDFFCIGHSIPLAPEWPIRLSLDWPEAASFTRYQSLEDTAGLLSMISWKVKMRRKFWIS
jgi:hypothetical protein